MIDFIGVGAQKSGTSWAYTCLYDHPEVCAPIKEIHFFSRPRWSEGREWYENHMSACGEGKKTGEFSTSYLYSKEAPERIHSLYPDTKIIAILRNPIDRAYSQYRNAIKSGEIPESTPFEVYTREEASVLEQGLYAEQIARYDALFKKEQLLVLIYEDIRRDPVLFMKRIYEFLGIDASFVSSMVYDEINVARTPKHVFIDRAMHHVSETLRKIGFDRFVHLVRKSGLPDIVRNLNTKPKEKSAHTKTFEREPLVEYFRNDVRALTLRLGRDMHTEWNIS
jgi:Sulfotransferase domain